MCIALKKDPPGKARQVLHGWSRSKKNYNISSIPSFSIMIIPCLSVVMPSCSLYAISDMAFHHRGQEYEADRGYLHAMLPPTSKIWVEMMKKHSVKPANAAVTDNVAS